MQHPKQKWSPPKSPKMSQIISKDRSSKMGLKFLKKNQKLTPIHQKYYPNPQEYIPIEVQYELQMELQYGVQSCFPNGPTVG